MEPREVGFKQFDNRLEGTTMRGAGREDLKSAIQISFNYDILRIEPHFMGFSDASPLYSRHSLSDISSR